MALGYGRTGTNNFATADFIVDTGGIQRGATHTTIQAAITDANSSGEVMTIFIRPGTYTENITISNTVLLKITAFTGDNQTGIVIINGKVTINSTAALGLSNIRFQTNGDYCIEDTGSNTGSIQFDDCFFQMTGNDAINVNNANRSMSFNKCQFSTSSTHKMFTIANGSQFGIRFCRAFGSATPTISTVANCTQFNFSNSELERLPFTFTSVTAGLITDTIFENNSTNTTSLEFITSGTFNIYSSTIRSGTATAMSIGAGCTVNAGDLVAVSTNTNVMDGAGTLVFSSISYSGSSSTNTVSTITSRNLHCGGLKIQSAATYRLFAGPTATGNTIQQVATTGTSGQVLTSNGAGALPTWQAASGGGAWTLISTGTASDSATIDFTGLDGTYYMYMVVLHNVRPATDSTQLWMRTSTDNGVSYDSGASDYGWYEIGTFGQDNDDSKINFFNTRAAGNLTNETTSGYVNIYNPSAVNYCRVTWQFSTTSSTPSQLYIAGGGTRVTAADVDAIRFLFSSGNISTGTFKLYGLAAS